MSAIMSVQDGQVSSRPKDENGETSNVCRDYLRNVCKRGSHCRYWHPPADVAVGGGVAFCHDFQNSGCRRPGCRFVHCSREEEDQFRRTGQLPTACGTGEHHAAVAGDIPVCKDFLKGECRRGIKCKYEHLPMPTENAGQSKAAASAAGYYSDGEHSSAKIRRTEPADGEVELVTLADYRAVEEENQLLKRDVDELRRTVGVLVAANEMLLEQNAKYRTSASPMTSQVIAAPAVIASSSAVAALSHIAIDAGSGLLVAQQPPTAASVAVATLRPCVTATATLHPVMTATARLHPIATATLHSVGTATLHQNTTTLHPVAMDPSPVSMAIGMPSHTIVPMTLTVAPIPPVAPSLTSSSHLQSMSTYVTYPIMSNGTHSG